MPQDAPRRLEIGCLGADLVGRDLRRITWCGREVVNRVYGAVRDSRWATIPGYTTDMEVVSSDDEVTVGFVVDHHSHGVPLCWSGQYRLTPSAVITTFNGEWTAPYATNRAGWCLLHPLSQVGGRLETFRGSRVVDRTRLPEMVAPQPLLRPGRVGPAWGPFDRMRIDAQCVRVEAVFEGALFETEDQRNWSDASFKTYSNPTSEPAPMMVGPGDRVRQRITLQFGAGFAAMPETQEPKSRRTQILGLLSENASSADFAVAAAALDGMRVRLDAASPPSRWASLVTQGATAPIWDLEINATDHTDWAALRRVMPSKPPERIIILPAGEPSGTVLETTPAAWLKRASGVWGDLVSCIGGGTLHNLAELQRHDLTDFGVVSFSYSPMVHADDPQSVEESLLAHPSMIATLRECAPGATISVGPVRDTHMLTNEWIARSVRSWGRAGADVVCVGPVQQLASSGRLTQLGRAIAGTV